MAFARFIAAALEGRPAPLLGDGRQERDFTYVGDVVAATRAAAEADGVSGRVLNVGGGTAASLADAVALIGELAGGPLALARAPAARGDVRATLADLSATRDALDWAPATTLEDGLAAQWAWAAAEAAASAVAA